jgi:hypothetical protein
MGDLGITQNQSDPINGYKCFQLKWDTDSGRIKRTMIDETVMDSAALFKSMENDMIRFPVASATGNAGGEGEEESGSVVWDGGVRMDIGRGRRRVRMYIHSESDDNVYLWERSHSSSSVVPNVIHPDIVRFLFTVLHRRKNVCMVCLAPRHLVRLPQCRHRIICTDCLLVLMDMAVKNSESCILCPMCRNRQPVAELVPVHRLVDCCDERTYVAEQLTDVEQRIMSAARRQHQIGGNEGERSQTQQQLRLWNARVTFAVRQFDDLTMHPSVVSENENARTAPGLLRRLNNLLTELRLIHSLTVNVPFNADLVRVPLCIREVERLISILSASHILEEEEERRLRLLIVPIGYLISAAETLYAEATSPTRGVSRGYDLGEWQEKIDRMRSDLRAMLNNWPGPLNGFPNIVLNLNLIRDWDERLGAVAIMMR